MIACPDALFYRIKFLSTYLGIKLIESVTGDLEN